MIVQIIKKEKYLEMQSYFKDGLSESINTHFNNSKYTVFYVLLFLLVLYTHKVELMLQTSWSQCSKVFIILSISI